MQISIKVENGVVNILNEDGVDMAPYLTNWAIQSNTRGEGTLEFVLAMPARIDAKGHIDTLIGPNGKAVKKIVYMDDSEEVWSEG